MNDTEQKQSTKTMHSTNNEDQAERPMEEVNANPESQDELSSQLAKLEQELADKKEEHLRALAELDNLRKRMVKERDEQRKYAVTKFARELLSVADNMTRAVESVDMKNIGEDAKTILGGVKATHHELQKALDKMGIKEIDASPGTKFDPNKHEVMFEDPSADVPPGHISQVLEPGYQIHDRLLRPARVGVAKGGKEDVESVDTQA